MFRALTVDRARAVVSAAMIATGVWHLRSAARREPVRIGASHWGGIIAGAAVIVISFAMDHKNLLEGGMPNPFNWPVFLTGLAIGVGNYAWAAWVSSHGKA